MMTARRCATFKALGALLTYPEPDLIAALPEIGDLIAADTRLSAAIRARIAALIDGLAATPLMEIQERYVGLFDRTRSLSLNLFEHVHGESRDRGQAMVDLTAMYAAEGLTLNVRELPDYLPLFTEFLSQLPTPRARQLLGEVRHILDALAGRLEARDSPYSGVVAALGALADPGATVADQPVTTQDDAAANSLEALDAAWAEEPAFNGLSACPLATRPHPGLPG